MKRKILAFALMTMMLISMMLPAMTMTVSAAGPLTGKGGAGEVTINAPTSLSILNETFTLYQVFELKQYVDSKNEPSYVYQMTPPFAAFRFTYNGTSYTLAEFFNLPPIGTAYPVGKEIVNLSAEDEVALTKALKAYIDANPADFANYKEDFVSNDAVTYKITNLPLGYYMIFGGGKNIKDPDGTEDITSLCILTTTDPTTSITLKADAPWIDKDVKNHITNTWDKWTDVNIGDVVEFQLRSEVPNIRGYRPTTSPAGFGYTYIVHDKMSVGLTFDAASVVITIGSTTLAAGTDYTLTAPAADSHTFDIVFNKNLFFDSRFTAGMPIVITYSAMLNENATIGTLENTNEAQLEYSNNPYNESKTGKTPWKKVRVYTFDIDIDKWYEDAVTSKTPLPGAKFEVYKYVETPTPPTRAIAPMTIKLIMVDENTYRVAKPTELANALDYFTTPTNGKVTVKGLDAGTYYLKEVGAPEGFNLLDYDIKVVIEHTPVGGVHTGVYTVTYYDKDGTVAGTYTGTNDKTQTCRIEIENKGGYKFPETGGIGTTIFYIIGSIITVGAGLILLVSYKLSSKKKSDGAAMTN